jgi:hypothetical protein
MPNNGILRRLQQLGRVIGHRRARLIVIKVPTLLTPVDGSVESTSTVTPETRAAADELLQVVDVSDEDLVIEVASYHEAPRTNGHSEPAPIPMPELISVT